MHPQELEEMEYNPRTELQNAYDQSRMEVELVSPAIVNALGRGEHVIVCCGTAYCPSTDALLGERESLVSIHRSRNEAEEALKDLEEGDDIYFMIRSPDTRSKPVVSQDDEVPF